MFSRMLALGLLSLLALAGCRSDTTGQNGSGIGLREVASGLAFPLFLTAPSGDNDRLFVVEKTGRIRIVRNGSVLPAPFLDLSAKVSNGSEQGLLGLAFHPGYAANGRFVVNYTDLSGDTRVSVFRVSANADVADAASEQVILSVDQPYSNHNGGMVVFGPDGKLYVGMGDGGSGGDPQGNGQNKNALLGKLLRLDVSVTGQVSVPGDNPFVGQTGARPEVWSYGLRNPWRFSFDRETRDLYLADVGQNAHEEIDVSTSATQFGRGLNFGWNRMEGSACYSPSSGCDRSGLTLPVLDYGHSEGCSVTGGYVYRGAVQALRGLYFYADYCEGWVRSFRWSGTAVSEERDWPALRPGGQVTSFGEDAGGELYVMTSGGKVFRIVATQP
jgi:glucose/arabinose dehydrogenase